MLREKFEDYLDGALSTAERAEVEQTASRDAKAAKLLAAMRSERALRAAAYDSYMPTAHEAHALASQLMAEARHAPVGHIGMWVRRGAAVAASIVIVTCAFVAGRGSAPTKTYTMPGETKIVYNVVYTDGSGNTMVSEFDSLKERNDFVSELEQKGTPSVVVAEYMSPGHM